MRLQSEFDLKKAASKQESNGMRNPPLTVAKDGDKLWRVRIDA